MGAVIRLLFGATPTRSWETIDDEKEKIFSTFRESRQQSRWTKAKRQFIGLFRTQFLKRCDLKLQPAQFLASDTTSATDIWIARQPDQTLLVMKLFINPSAYYSESLGLVYERKVYKRVAQSILDKHVSRNFVRMVSFCDALSIADFEGFLKEYPEGKELIANLHRNMRWIYCRAYARNRQETNLLLNRPALDTSESKLPAFCSSTTSSPSGPDNQQDKFELHGESFSAIVTEFLPDSVSMIEFLQFNNKLSERNLLSLLFQMAFSIHSMHLAGIAHQDMHWRNVLVVPVPESRNQHVVYSAYGTRYAIDSWFMPLIYDWDRSTQRNKVKRNKFLDQRPSLWKHGQDNTFTPERDWFKFAQMMRLSRRFNGQFIAETIFAEYSSVSSLMKTLETAKSSDYAGLTFRHPQSIIQSLGKAFASPSLDHVQRLRAESSTNKTPWQHSVYVLGGSRARKRALTELDKIQ